MTIGRPYLDDQVTMLSQFDLWWDDYMGPRMRGSRYLARNAWMESYKVWERLRQQYKEQR